MCFVIIPKATDELHLMPQLGQYLRSITGVSANTGGLPDCAHFLVLLGKLSDLHDLIDNRVAYD